MKRVAKFEKVSYGEFEKSIKKCFPNRFGTEQIKELYEKIILPRRATKGSAGYDFFSPLQVMVEKNFDITIPTGVRAKIDDSWVLKIYPRSGLGFKYGLNLVNTVGIIDSDYYYSDNEGHIMIKISHTIGDYRMQINEGQGVAQGVLVEYGITTDDDADGVRNGGFGSTGR